MHGDVVKLDSGKTQQDPVRMVHSERDKSPKLALSLVVVDLPVVGYCIGYEGSRDFMEGIKRRRETV